MDGCKGEASSDGWGVAAGDKARGQTARNSGGGDVLHNRWVIWR